MEIYIIHPANATSIASSHLAQTSAVNPDQEKQSTPTTNMKAQKAKPRERRLGFT